MKSFHARLDSVTRDLTRYEASESKFAGPTIQYTAEWIARLQCRNDFLAEWIVKLQCQLRQTQGKDGDETDRLKKVIVGMAKELGIQDVALAASKRKLDAANDLLKGKDVAIENKDVVIADLRDRRDAILQEDAEYFEELEACNKRQKDILEECKTKAASLYATLR